MIFDPNAYGTEVERVLALDGNGQRLMPLAHGRCESAAAREILTASSAQTLFPASFAPEAALSGLWLYFSCYDESHKISQDISSREGSFWHAILHRQEPDPGNSAYWFRRVGSHAIFPELREEADRYVSETGASFRPGAEWDPFAFIDFCESARQHPGSNDERAALLIQRAEWQCLFDFCARKHS
jgi:hypothetical protein